jgi:hypothetical protein
MTLRHAVKAAIQRSDKTLRHVASDNGCPDSWDRARTLCGGLSTGLSSRVNQSTPFFFSTLAHKSDRPCTEIGQ